MRYTIMNMWNVVVAQVYDQVQAERIARAHHGYIIMNRSK